MAAYSLDADEAVILQASGVYTDANGTVDLILTNKNLIQVNKGFFGGDKDSAKFPLSELKILNGKANVLIGKSRNGSKQIELYFINGEKHYHFNTAFAESKWANAIIKAHKERIASIERDKKASSDRGSILKSIAGTLESAKDKMVIKKEPARKACKCPKCGAELIGNKGEEVKCSYCDAVVIIK